jgi:hypothetical protein
MARRDYTTEEIERGLAALVKNAGNSVRASAELTEAGKALALDAARAASARCRERSLVRLARWKGADFPF